MIQLNFATIYFIGREFNNTEAICEIVFIAILVDYIIHFCYSFLHSCQISKIHRTKAAFRFIGPSIVSGALASLIMGIILKYSKGTSLNTIGELLISASIGSIVFSLIMLPSLLYLIGPDEDGEVKVEGVVASSLKRLNTLI